MGALWLKCPVQHSRLSAACLSVLPAALAMDFVIASLALQRRSSDTKTCDAVSKSVASQADNTEWTCRT